MKIRPKFEFKLLGTEIFLIQGKLYDAVPATNQPRCVEKGKIFVTNAENDNTGLGFLLSEGDYTVEIPP